MWMAEALWAARLSPWLPVAETSDDELVAALGWARTAMRASVAARRRPNRSVYRRAGRPCVRCGAVIVARGQGDDNRTTYWCPGCQRGPAAGLTDRRSGLERVDRGVALRAPHLYASLRGFVLGAFAYLLRELDDGAELPVAFVEHEHSDGPALYEYRPLVRAFVEERATRLRGRDDALIALDELQREPAAAIFARAHAGPRPSADEALFRTVLLGLLVSTAEACGGFDWDDDAFDRAYGELERSLFGERRTYAAVAPLVGISVPTQFELAPGLRVRAVADGELGTSLARGRFAGAEGLRP